MAVVLDVNGSDTNSGASQTTAISFAGPNISAGLTNSALVVCLIYANGLSTVAAPATLTRGAQTLNKIGDQSNTVAGLGHVAWYGLVNPTSGTGTITGTFASAVEWYGQGSSFQGVNQTGGTTTFANFVGASPASTGQAASLMQAITTANGDYTLAAAALGNAATTAWSAPSGVVQAFKDTTDPAAIGLQATAAQHAATTTSDSYTVHNASSDIITFAGFHLVAAAGVAAPPTGWLHRNTDDWQPRPILLQADGPQSFFMPSQIPVPQRWLPTTGEEDRPPNLNRTRYPDEPPAPYFRSRSSFLPTWLPTTGEEDRPSNPNRVPSPDQPFPWFVRSLVPVPQRRQPMTGQEDRPPNPNRTRSPDEPFPWFVRSPAPVPTIWLPQWDGGERPKRIDLDYSGSAFVRFPVAATVPISGIAWYNPSEDKERPAPYWPTPSNNFFTVQIPIATTIWLPTTGQEDRPPNQNRLFRTDESFNWFVPSPHPVPTTWLPQWDGWERPKPIGADPSGVAFSFKAPTVVSTIAGMAWFNPPETRLPPVSGDPYAVQTLPPFIEPPLQSFYAAANADDFNPLKPVQQVDARTIWMPRSFAAPVGISGIAWWRQAEVYREPLPLYRDYHPAWTPILVAGQFRVLWAIPLNKTTGGSSS